jgi:hypothetical protein
MGTLWLSPCAAISIQGYRIEDRLDARASSTALPPKSTILSAQCPLEHKVLRF